MYKTIVYEKAEGIATITMNRPETMNAINDLMRSEIYEAFDDAGSDDNAKVIIVTGAGQAFSSGADMQWFVDNWDKAKRGEINPALLELLSPKIVPLIRRIEKPIIASVNGPAVGFGASLCLNCDLRIASDLARFGFPFVKLAVSPEMGSSYFLPRLVGIPKALELMLTGRIIEAKEALSIGLVSQVVAVDQLKKVTYDLADKFAKGPPISIRMLKKAMYMGVDNDLNTQVQWESLTFKMCVQTEDHYEGLKAFLGKKKPHFRGK